MAHPIYQSLITLENVGKSWQYDSQISSVPFIHYTATFGQDTPRRHVTLEIGGSSPEGFALLHTPGQKFHLVIYPADVNHHEYVVKSWTPGTPEYEAAGRKTWTSEGYQDANK